MEAFGYEDAPYPIRDDLRAAYRRYWDDLAGAGSWWSGAERVAIADEVRRAATCSLCAQRKNALSPTAVSGKHDHGGGLPEAAVDAVHRVTTDATRLTRDWVQSLAGDGLSDGHYVELVGVVVAVVSIDSFHHALGLPPEPLPQPRAGEPSRYRPAGAVQEDAWLPWIPGDRTGPGEADLYPTVQAPNVFKAMSLVPDAVRDMGRLSTAQYMQPNLVAAPGASPPNRALDRTQIELVAARVSSINECFY